MDVTTCSPLLQRFVTMRLTKSQLRQIIMEVMEEEPPEQSKQATDVTHATRKIDKASGLSALLARINNRVELEQFLLNMLKSVNVKPADMHIALVKAAQTAKKGNK